MIKVKVRNHRNKPGKEEFHSQFPVRIASSPAETKEKNRENKDLMKIPGTNCPFVG